MKKQLGLMICLSLILAGSAAAEQQLRNPHSPPVVEPTAHAEVFVGRVVIDSTPDGEILIAVDQQQGRRGAGYGIAELVFVLQVDPAMDIHEDYARARVVARKDSVEVHPAPAAGGWVFALSEAVEHETPPGFERVVGFGLSWNRGRHDLTGGGNGGLRSVVGESGGLYQDDTGGGTSSGGCTSGGIGSSSCSLTCGGQTCSVTCNTGYYACCVCTTSGPRCKCNAS